MYFQQPLLDSTSSTEAPATASRPGNRVDLSRCKLNTPVVFDKNDVGYLSWLEHHERGFILNLHVRFTYIFGTLQRLPI